MTVSACWTMAAMIDKDDGIWALEKLHWSWTCAVAG